MENGVALDMACEREFFINFRGVYILLFLFRRVVRYPVALSANREPAERFIACIALFPVVFNGYDRVDHLHAHTRENRYAGATTPRGEKLRLYQGIAYRFNVVRQYGQEENNAQHRYGVIANGNVSARGVYAATKTRYEISVLPVDKIRDGITRVYGIRQSI